MAECPFPLMIRPSEKSDRWEFLGHWQKHVSKLKPFSKMHSAAFASHRDKVLVQLLNEPGNVNLTACKPADPGTPLGWICATVFTNGAYYKNILHMLYVRWQWRTWGVGTSLLKTVFPGVGDETIYHTYPAKGVPYRREPWRLVHDPYLVSLCLSRCGQSE